VVVVYSFHLNIKKVLAFHGRKLLTYVLNVKENKRHLTNAAGIQIIEMRGLTQGSDTLLYGCINHGITHDLRRIRCIK